ncbi:TetR/AcrR family transcriptional regulator [Catenulispora sp. NF23]|uniref:TetR/AcrR family transcriptional regulator n=1 Tax=Catenulispora pinistramenti TaxID=2705254 RepID=A0ABS5L5I7_9ACTN|nr:TetR/AcrR family transcriptional regulator [Catenulispora pinistramenti]MBS2534345.1 TetR/AcrR family transcriptional regulator [Catenulispora pinistramenti]MBS2553613.1 TetR/AcrR family transcriptional regulator [Catenulispora pinistramenti]
MATTRTATGGAALRQKVTDAIKDAVFTELAETGYAGLSMEAVARRAGVGKAALYRRWASKQEMLTELLRQAVEDTLPPVPDTGALHSDLRQYFGTMRGQLAHPVVSTIGTGLIAESRRSDAFGEALRRDVAAPRRAAARAMLRTAIERGELSERLDMELAADLLIAPLGFRVLVMDEDSGEEYLDVLTTTIEAALKAAVR